ncbi:hypothetical protein AUQ18_22455 [Escherichia coli]|nr:hypothetical protein AUQ18_22455 [Escherichia coli]KXR78730.1 hypothetical protein AUQ29_22120 [Escherichia coli]
MLKNQIIKGIFFLLHFIPDYPDTTHPFNTMSHNNNMKSKMFSYGVHIYV